MSSPTLRINYSPHPGQERIHKAFDAGARFVVAVCGRRWGKTRAGLEECRRRLHARPDTVVRWTSPTYRQAKARFREMAKLLRNHGNWIASINKSDLRIELHNGSDIQFWSTQEPENLRGEGIDFLVVDEAGFVLALVWAEDLRPMLSDTLGGAYIVGTPRGRGQFLHQCSVRATSGTPGWSVIHAPTWDSPRIAAEEIEAARAELPADVFAQEYGAEFLDSAAGVFRGVRRCIGGQPEAPQQGRRYVIGVDLAQTRDFSVILTLDALTRQVVDLQRFRGVSYVEQVTMILETAKRYHNADILVDETGIGKPVLDNLRVSLGRPRTDTKPDRRGGLRRRAPRVDGLVFTSQSKQDVIQKLQLDIERARIRIPAAFEVLVNELELYGYEMTRTGRISYGAPEGHHDDTVIALALAAYAIPREGFSMEHVDSRWLHLIEQLRPSIHAAERYGLPRQRGYAAMNGLPGNLAPLSPQQDHHLEFRFLTVCHRAGLIGDDEAGFLGDDLRRRSLGTRFERMSYSDPLDGELGSWSSFLRGDAPATDRRMTWQR